MVGYTFDPIFGHASCLVLTANFCQLCFLLPHAFFEAIEVHLAKTLQVPPCPSPSGELRTHVFGKDHIRDYMQYIQ